MNFFLIKVINGLKIGNDCLKKLNEMMSLDDIEQIMDDTKDAIEYQQVICYKQLNKWFYYKFKLFIKQIDKLLSGQFDNDSIEDELNEELDAILTQSLPEVPKDKISERIRDTTKKGSLNINWY